MAEIDLTVAHLELVSEHAQAAQRRLSQCQGALLDLEQNTRRVRAGRLDGRVLVDQAEDLRRAMRIHRSDQLGKVRTALTRVDGNVDDDARDQTLDPAGAAGLSARIATATLEGRRAVSDLDHAIEALAPLASADGDAPDLSRLAQRSIDGTAGWLEQARRATFQLTEQVPDIARDLQRVDADADAGSTAAPAADRNRSATDHVDSDRPAGERPVADRAPEAHMNRRAEPPSMEGPGRSAGYSATPSR